MRLGGDETLYIAEVSRYPCDVIWTGTDRPPRDMRSGDVREIEITGIGITRNPAVAEE